MTRSRYFDVKDVLTVIDAINSSKSKYAVPIPVGRHLDNIDSILKTAQGSMFGQDNYPTLVAKAAFIMYAFCKNHPLQDGNKRTALSVTIVYLAYTQDKYNSITQVLDNPEMLSKLFTFTVEIATSKPEDKDEVMKNIIEFLERLTQSID